MNREMNWVTMEEIRFKIPFKAMGNPHDAVRHFFVYFARPIRKAVAIFQMIDGKTANGVCAFCAPEYQTALPDEKTLAAEIRRTQEILQERKAFSLPGLKKARASKAAGKKRVSKTTKGKKK